MELRHRHPADAATTPAADSPPDRRELHRGDARRVDDRPVRDDADRHDPDAEFKRGVPQPPDSLHDDTGRLTPSSRASAPPIELHHEEHPRRDALRPHEGQGIDKGDAAGTLVDRPAFRDPFDDRTADRYGDPLGRPDGTRIPCFDGPPTREQARQGVLGDCGVIAALGAVAAHRPDDITSRVHEEPDRTYKVSLSEVRRTESGAEPTGNIVELTITPTVPVRDKNPGIPAFARAEGDTSWCPMMEKAFAGLDQTWDDERQLVWARAWARECGRDIRENKENQRSGPPPDGYVRMHQGTGAWDRAEILAQLTGEEAVVREFPAGPEEWRINRAIRAQLDESKPVLVSSRDEAYEGEDLPHNLEPAHIYEVTNIDKGKLVLRNPWNHDHPDPMETEEFARNMRPLYTTLA